MNNDPALLFLHALPFGGDMWKPCADGLPHRSYAPDLYGLGSSIGEWARGALDCVAEEKMVVIGCSVGGSCALEVAALAPERVSALVLIGTKPDHRPDPAFRDDAIDFIATRGTQAAWDRYWAPLFSPSVTPETLETARTAALAIGRNSIARGINVFHTRPSRGAFLRQFPHPVMVISGEDDVAPGPATCLSYTESAPQGYFHVVPNCGHYVPLERPDFLISALANFNQLG